MQTEKVAIFLNPSAGKGIALRKKSQLKELLNKYDIPHDLYVTQSEEDLVNLTREKSKEYKILVGAGGDSTFNIMINEIYRRSANATLGMIGLGSSNDIVKEFGVDSLDAACMALKKNRTRRVDLGSIEEDNFLMRLFLGQANVGLGVLVSKHADEMASRGSKLAKFQTIAGISGIRHAYSSNKVPLPLTISSDKGEV